MRRYEGFSAAVGKGYTPSQPETQRCQRVSASPFASDIAAKRRNDSPCLSRRHSPAFPVCHPPLLGRLGFCLEQRSDLYDFRKYLRAVQNDLRAENYQVEIRVNDSRVVHSALIRFSGLLYELELSPHRSEVLAIKLEVDTNPPAGAGLATTVVRRHTLLNLSHHNKESLLAGKLHAILQRSYAKGRDLYDLLWYLSDPTWPEPNLQLLNNALVQSGWTGETATETNWRKIVWDRLAGLEWRQIVQDVRPFLEQEAETELLTAVTFSQLLRIEAL